MGNEHTKGARKSTLDKHTKSRAGDKIGKKPNFKRSTAGNSAVKARHNKR